MADTPNASRTLFDPRQSRHQEYRSPETGKAVQPREAATLIIVRRDSKTPRILMGKRAASHRFMPNKFVFPGGRVDRVDSRIQTRDSLRPPVLRRLLKQMRGKSSEARARGLAMAALRETFEETGLVIGKPVSTVRQTRNPAWQAYFNQKVEPCLTPMDFILRAITPPYRTRRFDTRFFVIDAEHIQGDMHDTQGASGELLELHWLNLEEARTRDLPAITKVVLDELEMRLALPKARQSRKPVPFIYFRNRQPVRDTL